MKTMALRSSCFSCLIADLPRPSLAKTYNSTVGAFALTFMSVLCIHLQLEIKRNKKRVLSGGRRDSTTTATVRCISFHCKLEYALVVLSDTLARNSRASVAALAVASKVQFKKVQLNGISKDLKIFGAPCTVTVVQASERARAPNTSDHAE